MHKKTLIWCLIAAICLSPTTRIAKADELGDLKKMIEEQNKQLQIMQQKLDALEAKQQTDSEQLNKQVTEISAEKAELPESIKWVENVKFSGDLRYRHETIEAENDNKEDTQRHRIRVRLGLDAKVNDEVDLGFRIATGGKDPVSTNQTLGDSFSTKELSLDLAYFKWHPETVNGLNVFGGKIPNPFFRAGGNQLIWDDDLTFEGLAATYKYSLGDNDELFVNGGGFVVSNNASADIDVSLWGLQSGIKHKFDDVTSITGGVSYYNFGNIKGQTDLDVPGNKFFGNTSLNGEFANDFDEVELFGELGMQVCGLPAAFFGNYVVNTQADTSEDSGWLLGAKLNKAKKPGSWELGYDYRELRKDAVVGAFNDSDFIGGGTNGKGHKFGAKYQIAKNWQAGTTYFLNKRGDNNDEYRRLQLDLMFSF